MARSFSRLFHPPPLLRLLLLLIIGLTTCTSSVMALSSPVSSSVAPLSATTLTPSGSLASPPISIASPPPSTITAAPCPTCFFGAGYSRLLSYPLVQLNTITVEVIPHITVLPDGERITSLQSLTITVNESSTFHTGLRTYNNVDEITWMTRGMTLTWPTTYIQYMDFLGVAVPTNMPSACANPDRALYLNFPDDQVAMSELIYPYVPQSSGLPTRLLQYLQGVPTVSVQMSGAILSDCATAASWASDAPAPQLRSPPLPSHREASSLDTALVARATALSSSSSSSILSATSAASDSNGSGSVLITLNGSASSTSIKTTTSSSSNSTSSTGTSSHRPSYTVSSPTSLSKHSTSTASSSTNTSSPTAGDLSTYLSPSPYKSTHQQPTLTSSTLSLSPSDAYPFTFTSKSRNSGIFGSSTTEWETSTSAGGISSTSLLPAPVYHSPTNQPTGSGQGSGPNQQIIPHTSAYIVSAITGRAIITTLSGDQIQSNTQLEPFAPSLSTSDQAGEHLSVNEQNPLASTDTVYLAPHTTVLAGSGGGIDWGGHTVHPGQSVTLGSGASTTVVAIQTSSGKTRLKVGNSVYNPSPTVVGPDNTAYRAVITTNGHIFTAIQSGDIIVLKDKSTTRTILPGAPRTFDGQTVSAAPALHLAGPDAGPGGAVVVNGETIFLSSVFTATAAVVPNINPKNKHETSSPFTAFKEPGYVVLADSTSKATVRDGSTTTFEGATVSVANNGNIIVVDGTSISLSTTTFAMQSPSTLPGDGNSDEAAHNAASRTLANVWFDGRAGLWAIILSVSLMLGVVTLL